MAALHNQIGPGVLRAFMRRYNLTGSRVGAITGVSSRTVRRWLDPQKHETIPWAAWQWLRATMGEVDPRDYALSGDDPAGQTASEE